jgi:hypothetical protein
MATVVTPTPGNGCLGVLKSGEINRKLKCVSSFDDEGEPVYACATWRLFRVNCPKVNRLCSNLSSAYVAAITCCNQNLIA